MGSDSQTEPDCLTWKLHSGEFRNRLLVKTTFPMEVQRSTDVSQSVLAARAVQKNTSLDFPYSQSFPTREFSFVPVFLSTLVMSDISFAGLPLLFFSEILFFPISFSFDVP